ncbi:MAG: GNAT family N-acetyltransferase [Actinobacteria bacterium]|nr:GNAT family N-acetyltransferase [Actinomycetota bacterium]
MLRVDIRPISKKDIDALTAIEPGVAKRWVPRLEAQERGDYAFLVAWSFDAPVGRAILRWDSAYPDVRDRLGDFPEINGLVAEVRNEGVGTQLIAACERVAAEERAAQRLGISVAINNDSAMRLYRRRGFEPWDGGNVSAEWDERDDDGHIVKTHRELGVYLTKRLNRG